MPLKIDETVHLTTTTDDVWALSIMRDHLLIDDPFTSECGRFEVQPPEAYGVTWEDADALRLANETCRMVSKELAEQATSKLEELLGSALDREGRQLLRTQISEVLIRRVQDKLNEGKPGVSASFSLDDPDDIPF